MEQGSDNPCQASSRHRLRAPPPSGSTSRRLTSRAGGRTAAAGWPGACWRMALLIRQPDQAGKREVHLGSGILGLAWSAIRYPTESDRPWPTGMRLHSSGRRSHKTECFRRLRRLRIPSCCPHRFAHAFPNDSRIKKGISSCPAVGPCYPLFAINCGLGQEFSLRHQFPAGLRGRLGSRLQYVCMPPLDDTMHGTKWREGEI